MRVEDGIVILADGVLSTHDVTFNLKKVLPIKKKIYIEIDGKPIGFIETKGKNTTLTCRVSKGGHTIRIKPNLIKYEVRANIDHSGVMTVGFDMLDGYRIFNEDRMWDARTI